MSTTALAPVDFIHNLTECALRVLIDRHGRDVDIADLPWHGGILGKLRLGYPLTKEQVARVSLIRAKLARRHHGR